MRARPGFVVLFLVVLATVSYASIPTDSLGEGTCVGWVPLPVDTVKDTSFHAGDTLVLPDGEILIKPPLAQREQIAVPSVHTTVKIVAGDGFAHGTVTQVFANPFDLPFEATYIFPLPHDGAVHAMDFKTSYGVFHADLMEKEAAKQKYEEAKAAGLQASLLMQGQDNIFVQKLCNIMPRDSVAVTITFSMALDFDMGSYELSFPTTMIPRYDPVPLPKRRSNPTYVPTEYRDGSSLDFSTLVLTPYEIKDLACPSHDVSIEGGSVDEALRALGMLGPGQSVPVEYTPSLVRLRAASTIPNRDIVVRFSRASAGRAITCLSYHDGAQGYFAMNLFPSLVDTAVDKPQAIDMVFVIDRSGSMAGEPIAKAKEIMHSMLDKIRAEDRMSFLAFNTATDSFFSVPAPATPENVAAGRAWIDNLTAEGGTEMLAGVVQALSVPISGDRVRVLSLITDGAIGGVDAIYSAIRNDPSNTIVFAFGVGSSPNRELIDGAAGAGNGIGRNLLLGDDVEQVVAQFWTRIRLPQISDISIDWGGETPTGLTQENIPGLWLGQPVLIYGKYQQSGHRTITLGGTKNGVAVSESFDVYFVSNNTLMKSVPKMWARETIENLSHEQIAAGDERNKDAILAMSLEYEVLCSYTAFLAVADSVVNESGEMVAADVPIPVPYGVDPYMSGAEAYDSAYFIAPRSDVAHEAVPVSHAPYLCVVPERGSVRLAFVNPGPAEAPGAIMIFDLQGRLVVLWRASDLASCGWRWAWDGADRFGRRVSKGTYVLVAAISWYRSAQPLVLR